VKRLVTRIKSVHAFLGQPSFPFQSCTVRVYYQRLRVFLSIRALSPFLGGSSDEMKRCDFRGPAVQPGLQFSLEGARTRRLVWAGYSL
jgi:hypothetical protein